MKRPPVVDAHIHVIGPHRQYALAGDRAYDPPEGLLEDYADVARGCGITAAILVQPSFYGEDLGCLLAALDQPPEGLQVRGVGPAVTGLDDAQAARLRARGIVGVRVNQHHGPDLMDEAFRTAPVLARHGMHLQIYPQRRDRPRLFSLCEAAQVPVVVDHLGDIDVRDPETGTRELQRLLDLGHVWLKVTPYISSRQAPECADVAPVVTALAASHPDRLMWGSNWPHPVPGHVAPPEDTALRQLTSWVTPEASSRILAGNAQDLYDL